LCGHGQSQQAGTKTTKPLKPIERAIVAALDARLKTPPESHTMAVDFQIKDQSDAWPRGSFRSLQLSQPSIQSPCMGTILSVRPQKPDTMSKKKLQSGGL
jgi:hypothetical protein